MGQHDGFLQGHVVLAQIGKVDVGLGQIDAGPGVIQAHRHGLDVEGGHRQTAQLLQQVLPAIQPQG